MVKDVSGAMERSFQAKSQCEWRHGSGKSPPHMRGLAFGLVGDRCRVSDPESWLLTVS